jgi:septal ring-binding cell division protein DamX
MKSITIKSKLIAAVFFSVMITQTGCSSVSEGDLSEVTEPQHNKVPVTDEREITKQRYEDHLKEWQEVKESIQRLVVIEAELTEVITYLNNLAKTQKQNEQSEVINDQAPIVATPAKVVIPINNGLSYSLQLAAVSQKPQVKVAWQELTKKHPAMLMKLEATYEKSTVNNKMYYRIKAGNFADKNDAKELCKQLSALKTPCIVSNYKGTTF